MFAMIIIANLICLCMSNLLESNLLDEASSDVELIDTEFIVINGMNPRIED